jgi:hypothetical protein
LPSRCTVTWILWLYAQLIISACGFDTVDSGVPLIAVTTSVGFRPNAREQSPHPRR